jgi:hypothetical protein
MTVNEVGPATRGATEDICAYYEAQVASWIAQLEQIGALPDAAAHYAVIVDEFGRCAKG